MGNGFLTPAQTARIKAVRAKAWNRPFTVKSHTLADPDMQDYYDPAVIASGTQVLSGDYTWRDQQEMRGSPGGVMETADLILATDILNSGALVQSGVRLVVDGIEVSVSRATPYPGTGEIVIAAMRVT